MKHACLPVTYSSGSIFIFGATRHPPFGWTDHCRCHDLVANTPSACGRERANSGPTRYELTEVDRFGLIDDAERKENIL